VKRQKLQYLILGADLLWVLFAMMGAYTLRYGLTWRDQSGGSFLTFVPPLLGALGLWAILFSWMELDGFRRGWHPPAILSQLFVAVCVLSVVLLATGYLFRFFVSRLTFTYFGVLLLAGFLTIRYGIHAVLGSRYLAKAVRRVLIVGDGPVAREMATKIALHPEMLRQVVGFLCSADASLDDRIPGIAGEATTVHTLGVTDLLREQRVDEVIITLSRPGLPEVMNLASLCRREGMAVSVVPHPYELYLSKPQLFEIGGLPVLQLREAKVSSANAAWKRGLDLTLGLVLLLLSLPVIAIGAIVLLRKQGGPFCRELRCGQSGKLFWMYRLRSDRDCEGLPAREIVLQQLSITELPQFLNVLRGEMSLVGPRPESPERAKHYSDWQRQRLNVKPGITGLAQVHGLREQHSSEEKARFDLQYMLHSSPFWDVSLLLQTLWTLVGRLFQLYRFGSSKAERTRENTNDYLLERTLPSAHSTQSSAD